MPAWSSDSAAVLTASMNSERRRPSKACASALPSRMSTRPPSRSAAAPFSSAMRPVSGSARMIGVSAASMTMRNRVSAPRSFCRSCSRDSCSCTSRCWTSATGCWSRPSSRTSDPSLTRWSVYRIGNSHFALSVWFSSSGRGTKAGSSRSVATRLANFGLHSGVRKSEKGRPTQWSSRPREGHSAFTEIPVTTPSESTTTARSAACSTSWSTWSGSGRTPARNRSDVRSCLVTSSPHSPGVLPRHTPKAESTDSVSATDTSPVFSTASRTELAA